MVPFVNNRCRRVNEEEKEEESIQTERPSYDERGEGKEKPFFLFTEEREEKEPPPSPPLLHNEQDAKHEEDEDRF